MRFLKIQLLIFIVCGSGYGLTYSKREEALATQTEKLVQKALHFFMKNSADKACAAFAKNKEWDSGAVMLFVFDSEGTCFVDQSGVQPPWQKSIVQRDFFDEPLISTMIIKGTEGGWVTYSVCNSLKHAYVKTVIKGTKTYILGAGFFNESPRFITKLVVDGIKQYWQRMEYTKLFDIVSNFKGPLVIGNIYGIVLDDNGLCWAHGNDSLLIGQNLLEAQNNPDWQVYKKILETVKKPGAGAWLEFQSMGLEKQVYAELVFDSKAQKNFIVIAGYYPSVTTQIVKQVAQDTALLLGAKDADVNNVLTTLSHVQVMMPGKILKAELNFMVIDSKGIIRVFSYQPQSVAFVGRSVGQFVDQKNRPAIQMLFDNVFKNGTAWESQFYRNSLERLYGVKVETKKGAFVIVVTGYYPYHQEELAQIIAQDAYEFLAANHSVTSLSAFTDLNSPFIKGQIAVGLYDTGGYCWVDGFNRPTIWSYDGEFRNMPEGWIEDERSKHYKMVFIKKINKDILPLLNENFAISSGFYKASKGQV